MNCPNCGEPLPEGARFCVNCGSSLGVAPAPVPSEPDKSAEPAFRAPIRWPVIIPILMLVGFIFFLVSFALTVRQYQLMLEGMYAGTGSLLTLTIWPAVSTLIILLAAVLFFTPTRRVPVVTSIPRILLLIMSAITLVSYYTNAVAMPEGMLLSQTVRFLISCIPVVLYIIGCASKPRSAAIAVIHLVLVMILCVVPFFSMDYHYAFSAEQPYISLAAESTLVSAAANLFVGAAYSIALYFTRRKYYTGE